MITLQVVTKYGMRFKVTHPIKVFDCASCGRQYWVHDKRYPESSECPRCGIEMTKGKYDTTSRHEFLGPDIHRRVICRTCGGRSVRKTLEKNKGNCAKCGPYVKKGKAA